MDAETDAQTDIGHFIISRPGAIGRREIKIGLLLTGLNDAYKKSKQLSQYESSSQYQYNRKKAQ